jgi:uridine kinase
VTALALDALVRQVRRAPARAGMTRVLAIDGPAGSGKSTLAARLATCPDASVLAMDDIYPGWEGLAEAAPLLTRNVLHPLSLHRPARYRRYDWVRHEYADHVDVPAVPLLVVEGCACGSRIVAPYLSLLLWVEAPEDVRFKRGIARDGEAFRPHWERWARQEEILFAAEGTRERADYRIDGAPTAVHDPAEHVMLVD